MWFQQLGEGRKEQVGRIKKKKKKKNLRREFTAYRAILLSFPALKFVLFFFFFFFFRCVSHDYLYSASCIQNGQNA